MKHFTLTLTLIAALGFASCSGGGANSDDSAKGISIDSALPDTFAAEPAQVDSMTGKPIRNRQQIADYIAKSPDRAKYEEGIIPDIAQYAPEYASKLLDNQYDEGFLIVDKNTMKLYRYDKWGREIENVGIACAKNYGTKHAKADSRTPEGFFDIEGIYNSTDWLFTNDAGYTSPARGQFGPRFMRLRTPVTRQVGIHGTAAPGSIGRRCSHGCIRMTNDNILRIHKLCKAGMPVIVSPGPKDMAVNAREGYNIPAVPVKKGVAPCVAGEISEAELHRNNAAPVVAKPKAAKTDTVVVDDAAAEAAPEAAPATEQQAAPEAPAAPAEKKAEAAPAPAAAESSLNSLP